MESLSTAKFGFRKYLSERFTRDIVRSGAIINEEANPAHVRELDIHMDNTQQIYDERVKIEKELFDDYHAGEYNPRKALQMWRKLVDFGARHYEHEYGTRGSEIFTNDDRDDLAKFHADHFHKVLKLDNDDVADYYDK